MKAQKPLMDRVKWYDSTKNEVLCKKHHLQKHSLDRAEKSSVNDTITNTSCGHPNTHPHDCVCRKCQRKEWDRRKPIGRYHLVVKTDTPYSVTLVRDDGSIWSDHARAMSHLMKEIVQFELELQRTV